MRFFAAQLDASPADGYWTRTHRTKLAKDITGYWKTSVFIFLPFSPLRLPLHVFRVGEMEAGSKFLRCDTTVDT